MIVLQEEEQKLGYFDQIHHGPYGLPPTPLQSPQPSKQDPTSVPMMSAPSCISVPPSPPPTPLLPQSCQLPQSKIVNHRLNTEFEAQYTLIDELGSGGFGFVMSARRHCDQREVAVKFIIKSKVTATGWQNDPQLGMIPVEIFILRNVRHENIISYIDTFQDTKYFYLVMELHGSPWQSKTNSYSDNSLSKDTCSPRPGAMTRRTSCDLFECIEEHTRFPEDTARTIFLQIVACIYYLDQIGISHRDIKDENIVIDQNYHVKLIDFGSAVFLRPGRGKYHTKFHGTASFASPEILMGEAYRAEPADIWSLGVLLYTMLYGDVPFNDSMHVITQQYTTPKIESSKECTHLLDWMLAKHPDQRATIHDVMNHPWLN
ncbi:hypothetical protein BZG36_00544 [Bifiguratus adelaidae]|uniref:Protein kinase domain-containing protein n=1 Tax=Bifiguratus adelaidae TaxID=1938954 RepID=A0A261Y7D4_9FUNG|nr:hypothetical protein BZG36_00544 [Bifiguratus adelaidae]